MPLGLDTLLPDPFARLSDDELGYVEDRLAGTPLLRKDEDSERLFQLLRKQHGGDALREAVQKRFNPRQPRNENGEWTSVGGVVPKDVELAHQMVGKQMTNVPIGHYYNIGKKVQRGDKLTRSERKTVKMHVAGELSVKGPDALSPKGYQRYRDFAKVHGMNLKTKTKSEHPGKQVGSPGAKDARNMSDAEKIKAFEVMHGRPPTDKERHRAGMKFDDELSNFDTGKPKVPSTKRSREGAKRLKEDNKAFAARVKEISIREPDPDMERQRADERLAEAGGSWTERFAKEFAKADGKKWSELSETEKERYMGRADTHLANAPGWGA